MRLPEPFGVLKHILVQTRHVLIRSKTFEIRFICICRSGRRGSGGMLRFPRKRCFRKLRLTSEMTTFSELSRQTTMSLSFGSLTRGWVVSITRMRNLFLVARAVFEGLPLNTAALLITLRHNLTTNFIAIEIVWSAVCILSCYLLIRDAGRIVRRLSRQQIRHSTDS
jgi:hypothetical protein